MIMAQRPRNTPLSVMDIPPDHPMLKEEMRKRRPDPDIPFGIGELEATAELRHDWTVSPSSIDCMIHSWSPLTTAPRGVVVVFHGIGGHGLFPTVRNVAELLVGQSFVVYAMDFPGHGQSYGLRGYLQSPEVLLEDAMHVVEYAKKRFPSLPMFLAGTSMGGAVAIILSLRVPGIAGLILMAPMVSLNVPTWQQWLLTRLAKISPTFGLVKTNLKSSVDYQFRDQNAKDEILNDNYIYHGRLRAATAMTCVKLSSMVRQKLTQVSVPLLCQLADEDYVIDNVGLDELMEKASSSDKTLKEYNALHGLLCEEQPLKSKIEQDIVSWVLKRIPQS